MNLQLNQAGFLPLKLNLIIILILVIIPSSVCQNNYEACRQPFECGGVRNIGYPFYGGLRPAACGYPGFVLTCENNVPFINTSSITYRILDYDNQTQTVRVARDDLWSTLCTSLRLDTAVNTTLYNFESTNDRNISLFYGCTGPIPQIQPPNQFNCDGTGFFSSDQSNSNFPIPTDIRCSTEFSVRLSQTAAEGLTNSPNVSQFQSSLQTGFAIQWSADNQNCASCAQSGGVCGFNNQTGSFSCHCADASYHSVCPNSPTQTGSGNGLSDLQKSVIIGVSLGVPGLVVSLIIIFCIIKQFKLRYGDQESNQNVEKCLLTYGSLAPKRYSYNQIKKMTKYFKDKLGQGGYGVVYKGELPDGQLVAVKVLTEIQENAEEFINEVASICRTSHVNIVNLLGFCYQKKKRVLVYEYMPNKSLDKFIYKRGSTEVAECLLEMDKLYEIALGVARGLEYLHRGCNTRIVHFDIKPQNILLDQDFCPKISDFGLAKLFKQKQSKISMVGARGTIGYIAPEVFSRNFGVVSHKSDVYSYGMMLLEMAEARRMVEVEPMPVQSSENYFPEKIYEQVLLKTKNLDDVMTDEKEEIEIKMLMVGLWCIQTAPSDRPSMSKVVEMLEGSLQSIQIPPKPFFSSLQPLQFSSSINTDTENST